MSSFRSTDTPMKPFNGADIVRARTLGKRGGQLALLSVFVFVGFTTLEAALAMSDSGAYRNTTLWLRAGMSLALLGFLVGSHVWVLAPFNFKKETSRKRQEALRRMRMLEPEIARFLNDVEDQRREVSRGEANAILRKYRHLQDVPAPRMRVA